MTDIDRLLSLMARLRDPLTGCPWDRQQTFNSIAPYTIEEAYEVADAIERQDWEGLSAELGDLLFQVVYHSKMAEEAGYFDFSQVLRKLCSKMVSRHPHVFAAEQAAKPDAAAQKDSWEKQKIAERAASDLHSLMDDIPLGLPSIERALKIQQRAALVGFDWQQPRPVLDKIVEEVEELRVEIESNDSSRMQAELGDILFALVNLARHLKIDPAAALRETNREFSRRFRAMEGCSGEAGLEAMTIEEMEQLWQKAKINESN